MKGRVTSLELVRPAGPTNPSPTHPPSLPFPSPAVFPWWEHCQSLVDNWKLQSTESNYPEQDFPNILQCGVVLFVSSMCHCFRDLILPCLCPHTQPLCCPFPLCFDCCNAAQASGDMVNCVCLCVCVCTADTHTQPKLFPVAFLSCDSDVTISSLSS